MKFDILDLTESQLQKFNTIQLKLLRTAQQKKNELEHKLEQELLTYKYLTYTNGTWHSSLYVQKSNELHEEYEYQVGIIREQLLFNLELKEPTADGETGDSGNDNTGYIVDYELTYLERYVQVRDYYMGIEDANERLALFLADEVAVQYLGSYYNSLYNYLSAYTA